MSNNVDYQGYASMIGLGMMAAPVLGGGGVAGGGGGGGLGQAIYGTGTTAIPGASFFPTSAAVLPAPSHHDGCMAHPSRVVVGAVQDEHGLTATEVANLQTHVLHILETDPTRALFSGDFYVSLGPSLRLHLGRDIAASAPTATVIVYDQTGAPTYIALPNGAEVFEKAHAVRHAHHRHITVEKLRAAGMDVTKAPDHVADSTSPPSEPDTTHTEPEVAKLRTLVARTNMRTLVGTMALIAAVLTPLLVAATRAFAG